MKHVAVAMRRMPSFPRGPRQISQRAKAKMHVRRSISIAVRADRASAREVMRRCEIQHEPASRALFAKKVIDRGENQARHVTSAAIGEALRKRRWSVALRRDSRAEPVSRQRCGATGRHRTIALVQAFSQARMNPRAFGLGFLLTVRARGRGGAEELRTRDNSARAQRREDRISSGRGDGGAFLKVP